MQQETLKPDAVDNKQLCNFIPRTKDGLMAFDFTIKLYLLRSFEGIKQMAIYLYGET